MSAADRLRCFSVLQNFNLGLSLMLTQLLEDLFRKPNKLKCYFGSPVDEHYHNTMPQGNKYVIPQISVPDAETDSIESWEEKCSLGKTMNTPRRCGICLKDNKNDDLMDSSCYGKYFTQITRITSKYNTLWLCVWCRTALKRTIELIKLSINSERLLKPRNMSSLNGTESNKLYNLTHVYPPHVDIPPSNTEPEDPLTEDLIPEKLVTETLIDTSAHIDNEPKAKKRKCNDYEALGYERKHLTLDQQLEAIETKKERNKCMKFLCDYCGAGFSTSDLYQEHALRHNETGPNKCSICHLTFKSSEVLSQHMLSHKRKFKCRLCGAVFNRWSHCLTHRYKCGSGSIPMACKYCSKIYSNEYSLNLHIKVVHMKEKKYICEVCPNKFSNKQRLTIHMRSHTGFRPFACDQCSRTFTTNSNLRAHSAVHDDVSRFYCVECDTYYKSEKSLRRHFRTSPRHVATSAPKPV